LQEALLSKHKKTTGLSQRILSTLDEHGPLSICEIGEIFGCSRLRIAGACSHLIRLEDIQRDSGPGFCLGGCGKTYPRWRVNPQPPTERAPADTQRRANWNAAVTPEDHAWMQRYREQRMQRMQRIVQENLR
jgi:hypothetical protein